MEYTRGERREFWKVNGTKTIARCQIILINEDSERELASDHFTTDTGDNKSNFMNIVHTLLSNEIIDKYLALVTTESTIEYRLCLNNFPHALLQDQISDAMMEISYAFKLARVRLTLFFADSSHMIVKRLTDWVRELKMGNFSVLIGPILVSRVIPPPDDVTIEMKQDRIVEECLVLRKLWATLICVSRILSSEKGLFLSNYSGDDYFPSSVSDLFTEGELDRFTLISNMSISILSDNSTLGNLQNKLVIGILPFCLLFKLKGNKPECFSASLAMETSLAKYVNENTTFQNVIQTMDELCIELKKTRILFRRVKLFVRLVAEHCKVAQDGVMNVAEEMDRKPETVKGVKGIIKGVENLVKIQIIPKQVSMETHKNAEYALHKVNQLCIELDHLIRELNSNIRKYAKFNLKLESLVSILTKISPNCEGNDLLLILENLNYFGILSRSYGMCVQCSRDEFDSKELPLAGKDLNELGRMLKLISIERKWILSQLELKQEPSLKVGGTRQDLDEMLRKNKALQICYEKEIKNAKGLTAKGELENLIEFSLRLKSEVGKELNRTDNSPTNEVRNNLIIPIPMIYIKIGVYLDLVLNAREDSVKRLIEFATDLQQIDTKLNQLSKLLFLDDFNYCI